MRTEASAGAFDGSDEHEHEPVGY
ncbi:MAG: hypothetical protein JWM53_3605, partial [bacterium]|nr:hypothetical protein [bacterium]